MANKSSSRLTALFLLFALSAFSMACSRTAAGIFLETLDSFFGNKYDDLTPAQYPPAVDVLTPAVQNPNPAPPVENPAPPPAQEQPEEPAEPAAPPEQPPVSASPATVIGGWYGPYCDEAEGTYYYRWSVDLMQNPADGSYAGTVKFHNCPGGGRVAYRVAGPAQPGPLISLNGTLMDGGGALHDTAAASLAFTFDMSTGQITPNLAP